MKLLALVSLFAAVYSPVAALWPQPRTLNTGNSTLRLAPNFQISVSGAGAPADLAAKVVRLFDLDGVIGLAELGARLGIDEVALARAFTGLGEKLGLDWAQTAALRSAASDPWERLLLASLARDFEQMRLEFLGRWAGAEPEDAVGEWLATHAGRVAQFRAVVDRARFSAQPHAAMLAQIAGQARALLGR